MRPYVCIVGSLNLQVSLAEHCLLYRALLQKRPRILMSLLIVANTTTSLFCMRPFVCICIYACVSMYLYICIFTGWRRRRFANAVRETILFWHASVYMYLYIYMHLIFAGGRRGSCANSLRETILFWHESVYMYLYICIFIYASDIRGSKEAEYRELIETVKSVTQTQVFFDMSLYICICIYASVRMHHRGWEEEEMRWRIARDKPLFTRVCIYAFLYMHLHISVSSRVEGGSDALTHWTWQVIWHEYSRLLKLLVSLAEHCLFYRALLQKRPRILKWQSFDMSLYICISIPVSVSLHL